MPSPFPGMDPFLEGYLWQDVHSALANKIRQILVPRLRPKYVARLAVTVREDESGEAEIGVMYPDVEILRESTLREPQVAYSLERTTSEIADASTIVAPLHLPLHFEFRQVTVEVRDVAENELITSIELVSPVNKREPGLAQYQEKCERLYRGSVHLLEIDLLRRGKRRFDFEQVRNAHYLVTLTRRNAEQAELWPLRLQDKLPIVPIPLREPDPPIALDLQAALNALYDEAAYDLSIHYDESPPPPPLSSDDAAWMQELLAARPTQ